MVGRQIIDHSLLKTGVDMKLKIEKHTSRYVYIFYEMMYI